MTTPPPAGAPGQGPGADAPQADAPHADAHGSLSEEALKLAEALQGWLSNGAAMAGAGGSSECRVCPVCQLLRVVQGTRPEVLGHLTEAGAALIAAFQAAMESSERMWTGTKRPPVQHIKVT